MLKVIVFSTNSTKGMFINRYIDFVVSFMKVYITSRSILAKPTSYSYYVYFSKWTKLYETYSETAPRTSNLLG